MNNAQNPTTDDTCGEIIGMLVVAFLVLCALSSWAAVIWFQVL